MKIKASVKIFSSILIILSISFYSWKWRADKQEEKINTIKRSLSLNLSQHIFSQNSFPDRIQLGNGSFSFKYTINKKLQNYIERLLRRYRSALASVVVIENATGNILAVTGWERERGRNLSLPFTSGHPTASLAKIITSADLLENTTVTNETNFSFRGKGTTLYKYQLRDKLSRWTRFLSFEKAFALSNNVIFGKAAINNTNAIRLHDMATRLGFNRDLMDEINLEASQFNMPKDQYHLAELASGFNRETSMSPVHAAVLASVVANGGLMVTPRLLVDVKVEKDYLKNLYPFKNPYRVLSLSSAESLKRMMKETLFRGTAKRTFRRMNRRLREGLDLGGKTGSITGGIPFGKRDWFTMYAMPKEGSSSGISIAVMNVNMKKWFVKSAYLARMVVEKYYENGFEKNPILGENKVGLLKRD